MRQKLTLLKIKSGQGNKPDTTEAQKTVWAEIDDMGITAKYAARQANRKAELQVVMWRREYTEHFTHADFSGGRYRIEDTGRAKSDLQIKLTLARV